MPRLTPKTQTSYPAKFRLRFTDEDHTKIQSIVGESVTDPFFAEIEDAIAEYRFFKGLKSPTPGETRKALHEIQNHAETLRDLLANRKDEAGGALLVIRQMAFAPSNLNSGAFLQDLRGNLKKLTKATRAGRNVSITRTIADSHHMNLADRCYVALENIGIRPKIYPAILEPGEIYKKLLKWVFEKAGTPGTDVVRIAHKHMKQKPDRKSN